ncbi:MAG: polysaccharide deacetylase family protein [Acidobacteria bacterium]|nr:polysaccharide deacetylase family protein [Acidobacteriota bacterium]
MPLLPRVAAASHLVALGALAIPAARWPALAAWGVVQAGITAEILRPGSALLARNVRRAEGEPDRVALTFDDGPRDGETELLLERLDAGRVKATFFLVGRRAAAHPNLVKKIDAAGHTIGNHTLTHPKRWSVMTRRGAHVEVGGAQAILGSLTGKPPAWFRPPMGHKNLHLAEILEAYGLKQATWSVRSYDTVSRDAARVTRRVAARLRGGDIVLFHEGIEGRHGGGPLSLSWIDAMLAVVRAKGLAAVSLESLLTPPLEAPRAPRLEARDGRGPRAPSSRRS